MARMIVYAIWPVTSRCDIAFWIWRVSSTPNLADLPFIAREPPFEAERKRGPTSVELYLICESSRTLQLAN